MGFFFFNVNGDRKVKWENWKSLYAFYWATNISQLEEHEQSSILLILKKILDIGEGKPPKNDDDEDFSKRCNQWEDALSWLPSSLQLQPGGSNRSSYYPQISGIEAVNFGLNYSIHDYTSVVYWKGGTSITIIAGTIQLPSPAYCQQWAIFLGAYFIHLNSKERIELCFGNSPIYLMSILQAAIFSLASGFCEGDERGVMWHLSGAN